MDSIELRPSEVPGDLPDALDEVAACNVDVHLEVLGDRYIMLILTKGEQVAHLTISSTGRSKISVLPYELNGVTVNPRR